MGALPLCGCSLLIGDIDFASAGEDAGTDADAGQPDAGMDGATIDPDGGEDAGIDGSMECAPLAEVCDGLDNDCDGAVDEGLVGVLGSPISVDADPLGFGSNAFVDVAALDDGFAIAWHVASEAVIRVAVFNAAGTRENEDSITGGTGQPLRQARLAVLRTGAIEQVAVVYVQGSQIWLQMYNSAGTRTGPATMLTTFTDAGLGPDVLELAAVDDSVILGVTGDQGAGDLPITLVRFTPSSGDTQYAQVFPDHIGQFATSAGTLLAATDPDRQGDPVIRRHDPVTLELLGNDVWNYSGRCDSAATTCEALIALHPASDANPTRVVIEETIAQLVGGVFSASYCLFVGEMENGFSPLTTVGNCIARPSATYGIATRSGVAGVVVGLGSMGDPPFAYLEISTTDGGEGAGPIELSDFAPLLAPKGHVLAARGTRAYLIGQLAGGGTGSIRAWRLGCE
ncbi:MAG: putative metal-binding motif-containing protein [Sandaracinaceae bacterium]